MKPQRSRILVTGGTGFIGRHLLGRLVEDDYEVRVMSRDRVDSEGMPAGISYFCGDFTRNDDVLAALEGIDYVYHLAVTTFPGTSNEKIQFDARTNLLGSLNLMEQAAISGVKRFVFVSSGGTVYGPSADEAIAETHATEPASAHGVSKLAVEKYLEVMRRHYGMTYRIARGANPFGEGQQPGRGQGFIATALGKIASGERVEVWGDGSVVRDYVYIGDFVEALKLMLEDEMPYRVYNVGSGTGYSINEVIRLLEDVTGQQVPVTYVPGRPADVPFNCLNISRIQQALGWQPRTPIEVGIARTWAWVREVMVAELTGDVAELTGDVAELTVGAAENSKEGRSLSPAQLRLRLSGAN